MTPEPRDFPERVKAARRVRMAQGEAMGDEMRRPEGRLVRGVPDGASRPRTGTPTPKPRPPSEKEVREWVQDEIEERFQKLEEALSRKLETLAETDIRIIRELRKLQERPIRPPWPLVA